MGTLRKTKEMNKMIQHLPSQIKINQKHPGNFYWAEMEKSFDHWAEETTKPRDPLTAMQIR